MKSIGLKLFVIVASIITFFSLFLFYRTYLISSNHVHQVVNQQAALAMQFDLAIRDYVRKEIRPVMFGFVSEDEFIPETMSTSFVARSIFEETQKKFPGIPQESRQPGQSGRVENNKIL